MIRPEATGYGTVYFAQNMLIKKGDSIKGKIVAISGSGNVAQYALEKILQLEGSVVTVSDSGGYLYAKNGFDLEKLEYLKELKNIKRGRLKDMNDAFDDVEF